MIVLALAGVALSGYLLFNHYGLVDGGVCSISETVNCDAVNRSEYAVLLGVPVAALGLLGFLAIFVAAYLGRFHPETWLGSRAGILIVALSVLGAAFASYLTVLEIFVIRAICPLCVAAFGADLAILAIAALWLR
ncbi:MAG TPA: vitamin K epoxide reductase family protein [Thermoplasmata archaeon]|nr:vitamin K epoxide reductase family protein [Thermoplasmata archaeon]